MITIQPNMEIKVDILKHLEGNNDSQNEKEISSLNDNLMFQEMIFINDDTSHFLSSTNLVNVTNDNVMNGTRSDVSDGNIRTAVVVSNDTKPERSVNIKERPRPFYCEKCGKCFMLRHHLTTHMRIHTGDKPHKCTFCGKCFGLKHCLSTHLLLHNAERPFKCFICNKSFTLKHHLISHEKVHTRDERDRPFECSLCDKRFSHRRHLTTHNKFHSGERPFSCQVCGENFSREQHLVKHSRFHGGQNPFRCSDCSAGFQRRFELVNHERKHGRHPEVCSICGKEFLQKRTMLMHIRQCNLRSVLNHPMTSMETFQQSSVQLSKPCSLPATPSKKPKHICECGKSFTKKHGLFQHRSRNPDGSCKLKKFACDKCNKAFIQKNHLALHKRKHMDTGRRNDQGMRDRCKLIQSAVQIGHNMTNYNVTNTDQTETVLGQIHFISGQTLEQDIVLQQVPNIVPVQSA